MARRLTADRVADMIAVDLGVCELIEWIMGDEPHTKAELSAVLNRVRSMALAQVEPDQQSRCANTFQAFFVGIGADGETQEFKEQAATINAGSVAEGNGEGDKVPQVEKPLPFTL